MLIDFVPGGAIAMAHGNQETVDAYSVRRMTSDHAPFPVGLDVAAMVEFA